MIEELFSWDVLEYFVRRDTHDKPIEYEETLDKDELSIGIPFELLVYEKDKSKRLKGRFEK